MKTRRLKANSVQCSSPFCLLGTLNTACSLAGTCYCTTTLVRQIPEMENPAEQWQPFFQSSASYDVLKTFPRFGPGAFGRNNTPLPAFCFDA